MNGDDFDDVDRPRGADPRRHRSSRPLWLGGAFGPERAAAAGDGVPEPDHPLGPDGECPESLRRPDYVHDPATCDQCASGLGGLDDVVAVDAPEPDLGEIVVILLVSTLTGLRDRLERDGFGSAAALVHDLVEMADDYVMRFQP